jgi:hypothetical protein
MKIMKLLFFIFCIFVLSNNAFANEEILMCLEKIKNHIEKEQPKPPAPKYQWFKNKSDSGLNYLDNGVLIKPVKKPLTVHRYFDPVSFKEGDSVLISMKWKSDGYDGSNKDFDCSKEDPEGKGKGIGDGLLRCLAGTGDFRIGFFESKEKVLESGWCDGNKNKNKCDGQKIEERFNDYPGFQVRFQPHVHYSYRNINRLKQKETNESHTNIAMWTRMFKGENGLMSDECQNIDHCGFKRGEEEGEPPFGFGPGVPFGKEVDLVFEIKKTSKDKFSVWMTINSVKTKEMTGDFYSKFMPEQFDTFGITYTNSSRKYAYVQIKDFKVEKKKLDNPPTLEIPPSDSEKIIIYGDSRDGASVQ